MDREKLLKRYIAITICEWCFLCCWYWLFLVFQKEKGTFFDLNNLIMWLTLLCVAAFVFYKLKPEERKIMPLVISIHDTVEKLNRQRWRFIALALIFHIVGTMLYRNHGNIIICAIWSLWLLFVNLANFIKKKIDYLKEKPEGLNF